MSEELKPCNCKGHPFDCYGHPNDCGCSRTTPFVDIDKLVEETSDRILIDCISESTECSNCLEQTSIPEECVNMKKMAAIIKSALLAAHNSNGWQPIETAPKDGTEILVYCISMDGTCGCEVARFCDERNGWFIGVCRLSPTHWMPLPAAPKKENANDR